jgi:ABC-type lipoprotein release transport system permease subunit
MGLDPVRHSQATGFGQTLYYHKGDAAKVFEPTYDPNLPGCVLGIDLALQRDSNSRYPYAVSPAEIGFSISCFPLTAKGALAKAGLGEVNTQIFYYSDHSQSSLAKEDSSLVYLPFKQAQLLCGMAGPVERANAVHIKFKPNVKLKAGCEKVASLWQRFKQQKAGEEQADLLDTVTVQSWKDYRRAFIAAMEKEQTVMTVMFAFVGITTVFIVFVVLYMIISHKSKDIGILKSVGVSNADIVELFSGFAFLVGLLGSGVGLFAGWLFLLRINRIENWLFEHFDFQLWDRTIYAIGDIPNQVSPKVLAVIVLSAIVACLAGALVPSWQAAKSKPIETLQVNQL